LINQILCSGLAAAIITLYEISHTNLEEDITWSAAVTMVWTEIETGMYHITACLFTYQPLLKFLWHKLVHRSAPRSSVDIARAMHPNASGRDFWHRPTKGLDDTIELVQNSQLGQPNGYRDILVQQMFVMNETREFFHSPPPVAHFFQAHQSRHSPIA
jgi:hypothetical protein